MNQLLGVGGPPVNEMATIWALLKQLYGSDLQAANLTVFLANETGGKLVNHFYPASEGKA